MANRYWVWWTANRDNVAWTKRSATSGWPGGVSVPTAADDVFFDAASWVWTVTIASTSANCLNIDFTWFGGTLAGSQGLNVAWSFKLNNTMWYTFTWTISNNGGSWAKTFDTAGMTTANVIIFSDSDSSWTIANPINNWTSNITHNSGTLNTNNQNITCWIFNCGSWVTRTLTLWSSTITCTQWNTSIITWLTFNPWTSLINVTTASTFQWWWATFNNVNLQNTISITWVNTFNTLTLTGVAAQNAQITLASTTQTITNLVVNWNSATNRLLVASNTLWTARTLSVSWAVTWQYFDFRDITWSWTFWRDLSSWITWGSWDAWWNTNITFTTAVTNYWVGNSWSRSDVNKWASSSWGGAWTGRIPLPQDNISFDGSSFSLWSQIVSINMLRIGKNVDSSTVTNTPAITVAQNVEIYWSWTSWVITMPGIFTLTFIGRWNQTISCNWIDIWWSVSVNMATGSKLSLWSDFSAVWLNGLFTFLHSSWEFDTNNYLFKTYWYSSTSWVRTIKMGASTWEITWLSGAIFTYNPTNVTMDYGTSTIKFTWVSANGKLFQSSWWSFYNFWNATGSTWPVDISQNATFNNDFMIDAGRTQRFTSWITTSMKSISRNWLGTILLRSVTAWVQYNLSKIWWWDIVVNDFNIQDSNAVQSNTFYATSSIDNGNNTRWIFWAPPITWQISKVFFM